MDGLPVTAGSCARTGIPFSRSCCMPRNVSIVCIAAARSPDRMPLNEATIRSMRRSIRSMSEKFRSNMIFSRSRRQSTDPERWGTESSLKDLITANNASTRWS